MMQILAAAGVPALTDGQRVADESNPKGYLELDAVKALARDNSFLDDAPGHAVKIIHALLPTLPDRHDYRVLFMDRDLDEVLASQKHMRERLTATSREASSKLVESDRLKAVFAQQIKSVKAWATSQMNVRLHSVSHRKLMENPQAAVAEVADFLAGILPDSPDLDAMANAVDASLYRQRS